MKHNRISRILGIGLTIAVLASMFVVSAPVSAGNAAWSVEDPDNKPPTLSATSPNRDVVDIAVAGNGSTAYGVTTDGKVVKSTNGGATWSTNAAYALGVATKVAVAPDVADGSFVAVVTGATVVVSVDGGTTWGAMAPLTGNVTAVGGISVSPAIGGARSVAVAATIGGGTASVQYFTSAAGFGGTSGWVDALNDPTGGWTAPAVTGTAKALAIHYSTNFLSDRTIVVVTADAAGQAYYNLANVATKKWNSDYTVYGITTLGKAIGAAGSNVTAAAIDLPSSYMAFDSTLRMAYVALEGVGGGLYRASNWTFTRLADASVHSVAVNAAGDKLVAGAAASNNVYRVATPATALADSAAGATKAPSWTTASLTTVVFLGASVGAATSAAAPAVSDETAFGLSADDGKNFNDVAFIDTVPALSDLAVKADGTKTYALTEGTTGVTSLWRKTTAWERVFKIATGTGWIVRPALDNFDVIYLANCNGGTNIWYSNDAGQATWQPRISYQGIVDLQAESTSVLYVLNAIGSVSKAVDGGYLWDNPLKSTGAGNGATLTLLAKDNLLAIGATGVAYTTDGGNTWTSTNLGFVGATHAVADKLTTGGIITATAGTAVKTFTIGTSTAFSATNAATLPAGYAVSEMISSGNVTNVIYAMADNGSDSVMLRSKITATAWSQVALDAGKLHRGLAAASGKLISRNKTDNSLWSYTDVFAAAGPTLVGPAEAFIVGINLETGFANNVVFQWTGITSAPTSVRYTIQISLDSAFTQVVATVADFNGVLAIVGPTGAAAVFPFQADTTYYWRARASLPVDGPYSATRTFKIDALRPLAVSSPASGASDVSVKPTFVWAPVTGATTYEIVVSDDPTFKIITFSRTTDKAMFAADEQLAYGTVYYWRVRASAPTTAITPFVTGIFTTEAKPPVVTTSAPPITITTQPPATITVEVPPPVEAIPAFLLWIIILIGAILVIALIVLIVRTRRTS
jgi:hypothetical protein